MFAAGMGPALLQAAALALCPESPAWLLRRGSPGAAATALRRLHGAAFRPQDYGHKARKGLKDGGIREGTPPARRTASGAPRPLPTAGSRSLLERRRPAALACCVHTLNPVVGWRPLLQVQAAAQAQAGHSGAADAEEPLLTGSDDGGEGGAGGAGGQPAEAQQLGWGALGLKRYRRVMILAVALPLAQQASGINTVMFYSTQVWAGGHCIACIAWVKGGTPAGHLSGGTMRLARAS